MAKNMTNDQVLIKEYVKQQFSTSQFSKESDYFEFFASSQALRKYDLSDEEIERGLVGNGGDGGCDGVYLFFNDILATDDFVENFSESPREAIIRVVIVQAKNELSFHEDAIMKWKTISENLLQFDKPIDNFQGRYSEQVLSFFQSFKDLRIKLLNCKVKLNFEYIYVTVANDLHPNVAKQADELNNKIHDLFPGASTSSEVKFIGASDLMELLNTQTNKMFPLPLAENPISIGIHKDFIALVSLPNYYNFIVDENKILKKYIFEANVRDYQGHNSVNNEIYNTLSESTQEDFWWLNNGVTIIADDISQITTKQLLVTDPEIVNGLQTSTEIYRYFTEHPESLNDEKRNILIRIVVPENELSRDKIILATNSQTAIPAVALRSTDPIHRQIEMYFKSRGLYYDRRKNYYKNQGKKSNEIVSVSFLGQCLMSIFLSKPNFARARPSTLLSDDEYYDFLYIKNTDLEVFYKSAYFGKKVERLLKTSGLYTTSEKSDILFYTLYMVTGEKLGSTDISFSKFKELDANEIDDGLILETANVVITMYRELGGNNKVAKGNELLNKIKEQITQA